MRHKLAWESLPLLQTPSEVKGFYDAYPPPYKQYNEHVSPGDVIRHSIRSVSYVEPRWHCLACDKVFMEETQAYNHFYSETKRLCRGTKKDIVAEETEACLSNVDVYYIAVRPEETPPCSKPVEYEVTGKVPTALDRMKHDKEMAMWRQKEKETRGKRMFHLSNGSVPGPNNAFYYFLVEEWRDGRWVPVGDIDVAEGRYNAENTRVLMLLALVPRDMEDVSDD